MFFFEQVQRPNGDLRPATARAYRSFFFHICSLFQVRGRIEPCIQHHRRCSKFKVFARPISRHARGDIQLIFQDSAGALSPRMSAAEIIEEPLLIRGQWSSKERAERVFKAMEQVGLSASWKDRRPNELSGGQRQRVAIGRALVLKPKLLILDEALAGLDLSIQRQIGNLLLDLQTSQGLSYLFISHNRDLVFRVADEVAIISDGRLIEQSKPSRMLPQTEHPYVQELRPPALREELAFDAHAGLRDLQ